MYDRKRVFGAACLGILVFGIVMTMLGAILPSLIAQYGIAKSNAGALFLLMSGGLLVGSLVFGPIVDHYGYKAVMVLCTALVLVGLEGIAFASSLAMLRLAVFTIGVGGGVLNGGANALVADISADGRSAGLSLLGIFFGIGAFGVPFALGFLLDYFAYTSLVAGIGVLVLIPVVFFVAIRFPAPKQPQGFPLKEGVALAKEPALLLLSLILFLQSGLEIAVGGWTSTFFSEVLALDAQAAMFALSVFWIGMMLARLLLGTKLKDVPQARVLQAFIGVAVVGAVLLLTARSAWLAVPGIFLVGAGLAAGYPVILGFVGDLYSALSGTAFSIALVIGLTGGSLWPYLMGVVGEAAGLRMSFVIVPISLVLQLALLAVARRVMQAAVPHPSHSPSP